MCQSLDVVIAGVQKAGTTSLAQYLQQHPRIVGHDLREMPYFVRDSIYQRDFASVVQQYYPTPIRADQMVLAKSVGIAYDKRAAQRLHDHSPECKVLVSLRDPVERAYSAYWYMRRMGWETAETFEAALAAEDERREQKQAKASNCSYRARGQYPEQIQRLWSLFGPDQVRVLLLRDLTTNPQDTCASIFHWIDVDPTAKLENEERRNTARRARSEWIARLLTAVAERQNVLKGVLRAAVPSSWAKAVRRTLQRWNESEFTPPPMKTETRQALAAYFEPYNRRLGPMIERSLSHWTHPDEKTTLKSIHEQERET